MVESKENIYHTSIKIKLKPDKNQIQLLKQSCDLRRYVKNKVIEINTKYYNKNNKNMPKSIMRKLFRKIRQRKGNEWMLLSSAKIVDQAVLDFYTSLSRYYEGISKYPTYKSKKDNHQSFYHREDNIKFNGKYVRLEKIGKVKMSEPFNVEDKKLSRVDIVYDGIDYYISISYKTQLSEANIENDEVIGIDLGIRKLATCSNGLDFDNINKSKKVKNLNKRIKKLDRKMARSKEKAKLEGREYYKGKNYQKLKKQRAKAYRKIKNINKDYRHKVQNKVLSSRPKAIVIEDLDIERMKRNKSVARLIQPLGLYDFVKEIKHKCKRMGIKVIEADRYYASSQICSSCLSRKRGRGKIKWYEVEYKCNECGNVLGRDENASKNLELYGIRDVLGI